MLSAHKMLSVSKIAELVEIGYFNHRWYYNGADDIRRVCEVEKWEFGRFCDILALLSPRVAVRRNIRMALQYNHNGRFLGDVVKNIKTAVSNYETAGKIGGFKVPQFAAALRGDVNSIVLDSWMAKALFNTDNGNAIKNFRRKSTMAEACKRIAKASDIHGLPPRDGQACIWQAVIELHKATPAAYTVWEEYQLFLSYSREFPALGAIDASDILTTSEEF